MWISWKLLNYVCANNSHLKVVVFSVGGCYSNQLLAAYNLVQFCIFWKPHPPRGIIIGPKCFHWWWCMYIVYCIFNLWKLMLKIVMCTYGWNGWRLSSSSNVLCIALIRFCVIKLIYSSISIVVNTHIPGVKVEFVSFFW